LIAHSVFSNVYFPQQIFYVEIRRNSAHIVRFTIQ
jgi:hypothetical protein